MKLEKTFQYRSVWMGLALFWTILFHLGIELPSELLTFVKMTGYGGVDIFLFASGVGCYFSLDRDNDSLRFLKRRAKRLLPTYWCFMSVWLIYKATTSGMPFTAALGNILCIQNFTGHDYYFNWYMSAIGISYLASPLFYKLLNQMNAWKQYLAVTAFLIVFTFPFWNSNNFIIVLTRIPVFFLGMVIAKEAKQGAVITAKGWFTAAATVIAGVVMLAFCFENYLGYMWVYGLYWYPFILIVPGSCLMISGLLEKMGDNVIRRTITGVCGFFGKHSFEIYLVHIFFLDIFAEQFIRKEIFPNRIRYWLFALLCVAPGCVVLKLYEKLVMKLVSNKVKK